MVGITKLSKGLSMTTTALERARGHSSTQQMEHSNFHYFSILNVWPLRVSYSFFFPLGEILYLITSPRYVTGNNVTHL